MAFLRRFTAAFAGCLVLFCLAAPARAEEASTGTAEDQIPRLIEQLGADDYFVRERAQGELAKLGFSAFESLEAAENHPDVEVAARAKYLVSQMQIEWTVESDPPEVKKLLENYGTKDEAGQIGIISQLTDLPRDQGLGVLCRIVRFDKSALMSKLTALAIIEQRGIGRDRFESRERVILDVLGNSPRPAAKWLRAYLVSRKDPSAGADQWRQIAETEQQLLDQQPQQTRAQIVEALRRQQIAVLKRLDRREDAVAAMMQIVDLESGSNETLVDLVNWLVEQEAWTVVDEVARRFADRREPILLYTLAQAQLAQGNKDKADKLAAEALAINDNATFDGLLQHFKAADELQRRGMFEWCQREYRHVIKVAPPGDVVSIFAQHRLCELLHDQGADVEAAKICEEMLHAREAREKDNGPNDIDGLATLDTVRARVHFFKACHYGEAGDRTNQLKELAAGMEKDPSEVDVLIATYRMPNLDPEMKEKTRKLIRAATDEFRKEIQANPDSPLYYNQAAWLIANTEGDAQEAVRFSEKSLEIVRSQPEERRSMEAGFLDTLARCHYAAGDLQKAIETQTRAVELDRHSGQMKKQLEEFKREAAEKSSSK